jgi:excisionase family DNA binding protein
MTDPLLLTIDEAAAALRLSSRTVKRLVARGELRPVRIGARTLFTERELRAYIAAREGRRVA